MTTERKISLPDLLKAIEIIRGDMADDNKISKKEYSCMSLFLFRVKRKISDLTGLSYKEIEKLSENPQP